MRRCCRSRGSVRRRSARTFLSILAGPGTARTLEAMHRAHLLEKLVPAFARVRGLMQFNQYHKYTVDEHSLLAVAKAEAFATIRVCWVKCIGRSSGRTCCIWPCCSTTWARA